MCEYIIISILFFYFIFFRLKVRVEIVATTYGPTPIFDP